VHPQEFTAALIDATRGLLDLEAIAFLGALDVDAQFDRDLGTRFVPHHLAAERVAFADELAALRLETSRSVMSLVARRVARATFIARRESR
jgi:hypothetical protein